MRSANRESSSVDVLANELPLVPITFNMFRYEQSTVFRFSKRRLVLTAFYATTMIICCRSPTVLTAVTSRLQSCALNMYKDFPETNQPLFLQKMKNTITLVVPQVNRAEEVIELAKDEELILSCPGKDNKLVESGKNTVATSCVRDPELNVYRTSIQPSDALCEKPIQPVVKPIPKVCVRDGSQYEIGFEAEGWHPLITACYSLVTCFTYYTIHTIFGKALKETDGEPDRPIFTVGERTELFDPSDYYEKDYQQKYFQDLFGNKSSQYYNSKMFLARGHLVPDKDFIFASWQFATYFYINAAPQWQSINDGNWLRVEEMIRRTAQRVKRDVTVYTGTHGVLKLDDDQGRYHSLYLTKSKLPVPEFFWKAVHDPLTNRSIAFVTSNNPHLKSEKDVRSLCPDISCSKYKWQNIDVADIQKGLTYCCEVDDFRKSVSYLPEFPVTGILTDSG